MQITETQLHAAVQAIAVAHRPDFHSLTPEEKTALGQAVYWWFGRIAALCPQHYDGSALASDYWDEVQAIAGEWIVGTIRQAHPEHRSVAAEAILKCVSLSDLENQTFLFLSLAQVGFSALQAAAELEELVASFSEVDLDAELARLTTSGL